MPREPAIGIDYDFASGQTAISVRTANDETSRGVDMDFHFFVPLFLLLSRRRKRIINDLSIVAAGILVMRFVDLFWLVVPAFSGNQVKFHWLDAVAPVAIGGIWMMSFIRELKSQPLVPLHDPRFVDGQSIYQH